MCDVADAKYQTLSIEPYRASQPAASAADAASGEKSLAVIEPETEWASITKSNLGAAIALAAAGYFVFPAKPRKTNGRWSSPTDVAGWPQLASTNESLIKQRWRRSPGALPAICCDPFIVIDAGRSHEGLDGVSSLKNLTKRRQWPSHPVVLTPSGGEHHYFRHPSRPMEHSLIELGAGIAVHGTGSFVVGPGAVLPDGSRWVMCGSESEMPQLPLWLAEIISANGANIGS